jgi:hypothetical protein
MRRVTELRISFLVHAYREACLDRHPPQARCKVKRRQSRWYVGKDPDGWGATGS